MNRRNTIISILIALAVIAFIIYRALSVSTIVIEGRIIGARSTILVLERYNGVKQNSVDTLQLPPSGDFSFRIKDAAADPTLYELKCSDERVPLLAKSGDRIHINAIGNMSLNYVVEGSEESELLRTFYQPYLRRAIELKDVASDYAARQSRGKETSEIAAAYNLLYQKIKRDQLQFIIKNKSSIAAIYATLQYLPGDQYLINENSDLIYQRTVAEAVAEIYPESQYLKSLQNIIEAKESHIELMQNIGVSSYPEIELNDRFGKPVALSSLEGQVILLDFWSAELGESNQNNAEMKELYESYHNRGFEIYQVGVDNSKLRWINAIQTQRLPWISVSDLRGGNSPVLSLYNVLSIPSNILISRRGDIVARDLFGEELERSIIRELSSEPIVAQ